MGRREEYRRAAAEVGLALAESGIGVVYGGGSVGLMGVVADAAMGAGGEVIGVIPEHLVDREIAHREVTELHVVGSMHERKALMAELSDAFVVLPGGLGTMEETFEVASWTQLGLYAKPLGLLNVAGYFAPLVTFLDHAVAEGFIVPEHRSLFLVEEEPEAILKRLRTTELPEVEKPLDPEET